MVVVSIVVVGASYQAMPSHAQAPTSLAESMLAVAFDAREDAVGGDSFEAASEPSVPDEGDPVEIRHSSVVTFDLGRAPTDDDLAISDDLGIDVLNAGSAEFGANQQIATMVMVELDRPPDLADNEVTNVSLAFGFPGQETLASSPFANDPLLPYASVVDRGHAGDQEFSGYQQVVDGSWQPFQDPIATFGFHTASPSVGFRGAPAEERVGYVLAWIIFGQPSALAVISSHAGQATAEALYFARVQLNAPNSFMSASDVTSLQTLVASVITRATYLELLGATPAADGEQPVAVSNDEFATPTTSSITTVATTTPTTTPATTTSTTTTVASIAAQSDAAAAAPVSTIRPQSPSSASSSNWTVWVVVGGLLLLLLALGLVVVVRNRSGDGTEMRGFVIGGAPPWDPGAWEPVFDDDGDFEGEFVDRVTGRTMGADDPRFESLATSHFGLPLEVHVPAKPEDEDPLMASAPEEVVSDARPDVPRAPGTAPTTSPTGQEEVVADDADIRLPGLSNRPGLEGASEEEPYPEQGETLDTSATDDVWVGVESDDPAATDSVTDGDAEPRRRE